MCEPITVRIVTMVMPEPLAQLRVLAFLDTGGPGPTFYLDPQLSGRERAAAIVRLHRQLIAAQWSLGGGRERRRRPVDVPGPRREADPERQVG